MDVTKNHVATYSSFLTLSCICGDYHCKRPLAFDMTGANEDDEEKYLGKTPLLLLGDENETVGCLSRIFQYTLEDVESEACDIVRNNTVEEKGDDYLHVENCSKIERLRIVNDDGKVIARPLNETELFPDNMDESSIPPTDKLSAFLKEFEVPETVVGPFDVTDELKEVQDKFITSVVHSVLHIMLPETFNDESNAGDATVASYFRILMDFAIRRLPTAHQSKSDTSALSGEPLYLDLVASRPETTALPEIISGNVLLALSAGTFGWFAGVLELFELFLASLAFGAELAAFTLRWKAEVELENWEEDLVLVQTTSASRIKEIPLGVGRDMNPILVSITTAMLVNSEDRSTEMGFLIAGAIVAGVSLVGASYMGCKKKHQGSKSDAMKDPMNKQESPGPQEQAPDKLKESQPRTSIASIEPCSREVGVGKPSMPPVKAQCVKSAPQLSPLTSESGGKQMETETAENVV